MLNPLLQFSRTCKFEFVRQDCTYTCATGNGFSAIFFRPSPSPLLFWFHQTSLWRRSPTKKLEEYGEAHAPLLLPPVCSEGSGGKRERDGRGGGGGGGGGGAQAQLFLSPLFLRPSFPPPPSAAALGTRTKGRRRRRRRRRCGFVLLLAAPSLPFRAATEGRKENGSSGRRRRRRKRRASTSSTTTTSSVPPPFTTLRPTNAAPRIPISEGRGRGRCWWRFGIWRWTLWGERRGERLDWDHRPSTPSSSSSFLRSSQAEPDEESHMLGGGGKRVGAACGGNFFRANNRGVRSSFAGGGFIQ